MCRELIRSSGFFGKIKEKKSRKAAPYNLEGRGGANLGKQRKKGGRIHFILRGDDRKKGGDLR